MATILRARRSWWRKPKINSKGQITLRFRLSRGTYRMRYSFKGNSVMARGTIYETIRIKRVIG